MGKDPLRDAFFEQMDTELARFVDPQTGRAKLEYVEHIPCPLCGESEYTLLFVKHGLDFVRCASCGFVYVNPRLKESIMLEGYTGDAEAASNRIWKDVLLSTEQQAFNTEAYGIVLDQIGVVRSKGKLLDVGCSVGHFLDLAQKRGYEVEGLEVEPEALAIAQKRGFTVHADTLEAHAYAADSFDVVTLLGLIEHVPNPVGLLQDAWRILKPGGVVAVNGVPNVESLMVMVLREKARTFNGRNHVGYYSPRTLRLLFEKTGFALKWYGTYVTGLDPVINHAQFGDTFGNPDYSFLPDTFCTLLESGRRNIEEWIITNDLGYKLRAVAIKL